MTRYSTPGPRIPAPVSASAGAPVLTISGCTISGNNPTSFSGAGLNLSGFASATITNSTFANNTANGGNLGGAILLSGANNSATLTNCTINGNTAGASGGGICVATGATLNLSNTIVANNTATNGPDIFGTVTSATNDLVFSISGTTGVANNVNGNIVGVNPNLGGAEEQRRPHLDRGPGRRQCRHRRRQQRRRHRRRTDNGPTRLQSPGLRHQQLHGGHRCLRVPGLAGGHDHGANQLAQSVDCRSIGHLHGHGDWRGAGIEHADRHGDVHHRRHRGRRRCRWSTAWRPSRPRRWRPARTSSPRRTTAARSVTSPSAPAAPLP